MELFEQEMFNYDSNNEIRKVNMPQQCGICGENHFPTDCTVLKVKSYIPNKIIPSKARLTLPDNLEIVKLSDGTYNVYARCIIERGTQFGPFEARKLLTLLPCIDFPLKIFTNASEDLSEYFLDTSDENECNWMMFVSSASDIEEQNVICYQDGEHLYYSSIKDIQPGQPLKVWYAPYYAVKMKKSVLSHVETKENEFKMDTGDAGTSWKRKRNVIQREKWSCKFCGKVERELIVFAVHLIDHYTTQAKRICAICKDSFRSYKLLQKHIKIVHANNLIATTETKQEISAKKVKDSDSRDTCVGGPLLLNTVNVDSLDNSSLFLPQSELRDTENQNLYMESDNLNVDNIINENVKQLDHFNFELKEPESEPLLCDICLKSFTKLSSLIQHLGLHSEKFFCNQCKKAFARKENLFHHRCNCFYTLKCPLCEKIFTQMKYLSHHMKGTHNKEFSCKECNQCYISKQALAEHTCPKIPFNKKQKYPCPICSKVFFSKKGLYEHKLRHEKKGPEKITCEQCSMALGSRKIYLNHLKIHEQKNFPCNICNRVYSRSDTLQFHKKVQHRRAENPVTCNICDKTIKTRKLLKEHLRMHSASRPFKCNSCVLTFKTRPTYIKHLKSHKCKQKASSGSLFKENMILYSCPNCGKYMKLKSSLLRHIRKFHPDYKTFDDVKPQLKQLEVKKSESTTTTTQVCDEVLKETIENMAFNIDEHNEINIEIDKLLSSTDNIDNLLNYNDDHIVENLIRITEDQNRNNTNSEVCLSMPELTTDDEIKLDDNAYILEDGTIVQPQDTATNVVMYILDENKFT